MWKKETSSIHQQPSSRLLRKQCKIESERLPQTAPARKSTGNKSGSGVSASSSGSKAQTAHSGIFDDIVSFSSNRNIPNIVVQISQHSSFDPEQYVLYKSSLSTQDISSLPHQDTGPDESFLSADSSISQTQDRNRIVPDSQSLADSSSYIPSSTAENVPNLNQSAQEVYYPHILQITQTSDLKTTSQSEAIQSIERFSSSSVTANKELEAHLRRPRFASSQPSSAVSNNSLSEILKSHVSRSQSDPDFSSSSNLRQSSSHQVSANLLQSESPSSRVQESSESHHSHPIQVFHSGGPDPDPEFQTQAPLFLDSQATQSSTDFLGESADILMARLRSTRY